MGVPILQDLQKGSGVYQAESGRDWEKEGKQKGGETQPHLLSSLMCRARGSPVDEKGEGTAEKYPPRVTYILVLQNGGHCLGKK